jgi:predicted phosphodiesterase
MNRSRQQNLPTRRTAMKVGLASAVLWPTCLQASAAEREELAFTIVTDTHLGYHDKDSAAKLWQETATEINLSPGKLMLHLGDIVDAGREEQYPIYLKNRELIKKSVHEIGGNHDPEELFRKYFRSSNTQVTIRDGAMKLQYKPTGSEASLDKQCTFGKTV